MKTASLLIGIVLTAQLTIFCQTKIFISPFVGTNFTINSNDHSAQKINTPTNDFQFVYPKVHYSKLQPFTFGFLADYQKDKHRISTGIIFSDALGSYMKFGISTLAVNPIFDEFSYAAGGTWLARTATKIPVDYSFKLISAHHIGNVKSFFDMRVRVGLNLLFMRRWDKKSFGGDMVAFTENGENAYMIQPKSRAYYTLDGNQAGFITWECNLQKFWSISFKAGLEFDWYLKNKRRITTSFYYEQGTRNMSAMVNQIYYNNIYQGSNIIYSRGSAIQFKLAFPIQVFEKEKVK
ncbi:MAG: hypothetical protein IPM74_07425 [Crocinitomicaceae bacterium]|nr:hypothetical protein [Crocinitomicaceae bacterium]MBK8925730.1 hypothetical protein [Crocinitomicaceae bacterium]